MHSICIQIVRVDQRAMGAKREMAEFGSYISTDFMKIKMIHVLNATRAVEEKKVGASRNLFTQVGETRVKRLSRSSFIITKFS